MFLKCLPSFLHVALKSKLLSEAYQVWWDLVPALFLALSLTTHFLYTCTLYTNVITIPQVWHALRDLWDFARAGMAFLNSSAGELTWPFKIRINVITFENLPLSEPLVAPSSVLPTTLH